ncbi:MAG TPA: glycosyltransferase [Cytophagaceae bacterium]|jgi:colanic acid/amylovoran biosynthesis glycosyltransferase|nr:glycosyltransferase [Cytophagaceae bacterium]
MSLTEKSVPNVALYVDDFLLYTHVWIYRQVSDPVTNVKTVLCHLRTEEITFPFPRCVTIDSHVKIKEYIKGRFWFLFKYLSPRLSKKSVAAFTQELEEQQINLVHAHFGTNGVMIAPVCERLNIPLVVTFHGFDISSAVFRWPAYKKKLNELFHQITYAIAISEEMAERLLEIGCPKEKIRVSYLGVPLDDFPFIKRSAEKAPLVFLHAGRLTAKKGVSDLVKAFSQAFETTEQAELWIAGDGEEKSQVEKMIRTCNATGKVKLLGRLSDEELRKIRNQADVFIINCRTDAAGTKEGLPISILEACATGMPVISTFHAGIPEAILQNHTGILVPEFDQAALALAMRKMLDPVHRTEMGVRANEYMKEKFALEECNKKLRLLYNEALIN